MKESLKVMQRLSRCKSQNWIKILVRDKARNLFYIAQNLVQNMLFKCHCWDDGPDSDFHFSDLNQNSRSLWDNFKLTVQKRKHMCHWDKKNNTVWKVL